MFHPTPWHFWPVVTVAFVWHLIGVIDYTATQLSFDFWMAMVTDRQETFIETMPDWIDGAWAFGVWFGLLGVLLMAFRVAFAPLILGLSFISILVLVIWLLFFATPSLVSVSGPVGISVIVLSALISLLIWLYARAMHKERVIN
ncbi:hypothetical protein [Palleronia sp. LCG004]|uniref:hypothetical protein n=1 Tax=Palleronia sp. LCG004 TaxID=3079304 RepID=UPI002942545D|nr:hypothetical protein [Palleronia sp. LCG004]WOI57211.1 hypothetical protein RVY76_05330 [Palleronia sp. LCG004]